MTNSVKISDIELIKVYDFYVHSGHISVVDSEEGLDNVPGRSPALDIMGVTPYSPPTRMDIDCGATGLFSVMLMMMGEKPVGFAMIFEDADDNLIVAPPMIHVNNDSETNVKINLSMLLTKKDDDPRAAAQEYIDTFCQQLREHLEFTFFGGKQ